MKNILRPANRPVLAHFASENALLAFDFDGTLAPISPLRDVVTMRPRTAELLQRACETFRCAIVTGRSRADVLGRLGGIDVAHVIGNHGLEPSDQQPSFAAWATRAAPLLEKELSGTAGIDLENKQYSITVHYRKAPSQPQALRAIMQAVGGLEERPRVVGGKLVVNLMPLNAPHKGSALAALMRREGMQRVIYVGDDQTDEDVFAGASPSTLLGIRVGRSPTSKARYYVRDQERIDDLLEALIALQTRSQARGA